ncbi:hypothetical protein GTY68_11210 [Streptomyces sp. SID4926]|nr:hypothetical protein [Streptomyces sp. SID4926]
MRRPSRQAQERPSAPDVPGASAALLGLQRAAGNAAVVRALSGQSDAPAVQRVATTPVQRVRGDEYPEGTYGKRAKERKYLEQAFDTDMGGDHFQVEHAHGYASTARHAPVPRKSNTRHEGEIFAYYETLAAHRDHRGTGSSGQRGSTGVNSRDYRDRQEEYLLDDNPYGSLEINQLEYGMEPSFHAMSGTRQGKASDASFRRALKANPRTPIYDHDGTRRHARSLRPGEQARLDLMRGELRDREELPYQDKVKVLRDEYGGSRFDEYPTRSRGPADGEELTDFFDAPREKSSSQRRALKRLARTPYKRDYALDLDEGGRGRSRSPFVDDEERRGRRGKSRARDYDEPGPSRRDKSRTRLVELDYDDERPSRRGKSRARPVELDYDDDRPSRRAKSRARVSDWDDRPRGSRYDAPAEDDYLLSQPSEPLFGRFYDGYDDRSYDRDDRRYY